MTTTDGLDVPAEVDRLVDQLLAQAPPGAATTSDVLGAQFDRGLAWVHFPEGCGGLGLSPGVQRRVGQPAARGRGPVASGLRNIIGYGMVAPDPGGPRHPAEQKAATCGRCSPARRSGASCSASPGPARTWPAWPPGPMRDGDEWVLNGQKVWTTLAHLASFGLLLARTDPDLPKHQGITCFLVDMHAPGRRGAPALPDHRRGRVQRGLLHRRPTSPTRARLGGVGEGWRVALTTLMNERVARSAAGSAARGEGPIGDAAGAVAGALAGATPRRTPPPCGTG